jgi:Cof subfamily protein (haloacid dehalogenase superfamily)
MDGTLLNSKGLISYKNEVALKKLQNKGVEIVIASGRTDLMMKQYINQLNLKGHIICCNGAIVKNIEKNKVIYSKTLDKETADYIIEFFLKSNFNFLIYTEDIVFSNKDNYRAKHFEDLNESMPVHLRTPIKYFDLDSINIIGNREIIKILLVESDDNIRDSVTNQLKQFSNISVVSSAKGLLDIWAANISKGSAIKVLSERFGVNLENVIAFGDNNNDVELFETVGMPIAMGNAVEQIKSIAKYVTQSNDDDGIAYAIDNFILNIAQ